MAGTVPEKIWLYRITHYSNLPHILRHGIVTSKHPDASNAFVSIGKATLIESRSHTKVPVPPYGELSDYVPFYFGPHSPMLFQIITGNGGVPKKPQGEIVYLISSLDRIIEAGCRFCFTDGHAWNSMSRFYDDAGYLYRIDWEMVKEKQWSDTEEDFDRKRRKQAELLVHFHVPVSCVDAIVVNDEERLNFAKNAVEKAMLSVPVHLSTGKKHFY